MSDDQHNILIIGAGLAGLYAALTLAPQKVTVLSPEPLGFGASSAWAQGGVAAAMDENDTPEAHALDTVNAGDGIVDADIAKFVTAAAKEHVLELAEVGTPFDRTPEGGFVMSKEAAHGFARVVRVKGDQAGAAIMKTLVEEVQRSASITVLEGYTALELISKNNAMQGVVVSKNGAEPEIIQAKAYLLAAGGAGSLYMKTTNPPSVRGLALGMAARAGAKIADAEFVQFHPTAIDLNLDPAPLATEALRGEGATLINKHGERYMLAVHADAELAPRDIVARANFHQHQIGNVPMLDTRAAIGDHIIDEFPSVSGACLKAGIDPTKQPIPIVPAAHYHMGGVFTDQTGMSSIDGLWVAGEASSTGLHGANRLASNGLLEALVYAATCAAGMLAKLNADHGMVFHPDLAVPALGHALVDESAVLTLRETMSAYVGVIRDADGMATALRKFKELDAQYGGKSTNFDNMLAAATLIAAAAYNRKESRGGHYRTDYPEKNDTLRHRTEITLNDAIALRNSL
ncbi:L-aspartate oxidase [Amylibacter ulvae]|uniref:L-aspartate oxidase n=1 Tax=Paramylibacter ulvae TaxID=1651968 RepID=A0ABQ3D249_9RHOB|nr:L-aspartate oxidase [Amylibacter ulvae]GHA47666.1 L-aspartate oxidase [Amylibacter ulvae]